MFGIDEAGKGPVLGPMVIGIVEVTDESVLPDGLADSKKLSESRRTELDEKLRDNPNVRVGTVCVQPEEIDDPETDMNTLTVQAHADAINELEPTTEGFLDASDTDEERFRDRVSERTNNSVQLTAEHGADDEYDIVAAASIIAKVKRDSLIELLDANYTENIGSGYPSDPNTRDFLKSYIEQEGNLPPCARASWKTSKDMLEEAGQSTLSDL